MPHPLLPALTPANSWTLTSAAAEVVVEKSTGRLRGFAVRRGGKLVDLFAQMRGRIPGYIGGLRIYDELERRWHDDFHSEPRVTHAKASAGRLTLEKEFRGCPFRIKLDLRLRGAALEWDATLTQDRAVNRGVRVHFFLPLIAGWHCWTAANTRADGGGAGLNQPWPFDGMGSFEFMYNQGPYFGDRELCVPVFSTFHAGQDAGFTFCDRFERNVPAAKFQFSNAERSFNWGFQEQPHLDALPYFEHVHYHIGLHGRTPCVTGGLVFCHGGDWRPGLGQVFQRYKAYFVPPVPAILERQGTFMCGSIHTADNVEEFKSWGGKYLEVHGHFPFYGDYFHEGAKSWKPLDQFENEKLGRVRPGPQPARLSRALIIEKLKQLRQAGISSHYYTNYTDGYMPWIERRHPDSICKKEDGSYGPSGWRFCHCINPDPDFSYGRFTIAQTKKILKVLGPHLDGFFLDCFRHFELDFAHSDGVTMVNNTPAYSNNHALSRIQERVGRLLQAHNKDCFANKPRTIQNMRHVDGVLLEGHGDGAEVKFYFACIAKPLFFMWTGLAKPQEEYLKRCVVYGGWPRDPILEGKTPEERERSRRLLRALYARYLPLFRLFKGRVLCFEPDPIAFSDGVYGQLYTLPDGSYIAGCMSDDLSSSDLVRYETPRELRFRLPRMERLNDVLVFYPGDPVPRPVEPREAGAWRVVPMERYTSCAAVLIREGGAAALRKRLALRDRKDYCGDPVSAFELGSGANED